MKRSVSCRLEADIVGTCDIVLSIAVAAGAPLESETLSIDVDGVGVDFREVHDDHGVRLHCANGLLTGRLVVGYQATVDGTVPAPPVTEIDIIRYARPSRYCESDRLADVVW